MSSSTAATTPLRTHTSAKNSTPTSSNASCSCFWASTWSPPIPAPPPDALHLRPRRGGVLRYRGAGGARMMTHPLLPKLKALRLSGMLQTLDTRATQAAERNLTPTEFLAIMLDDELERREGSRL